MRLSTEAEIFLFNNSGAEYTASITDVKRNAITVMINDVKTLNRESPFKINLGQVLSKNAKFDLIIQKATELGVHSITPLYSEHAIVKQVNERMNTKNEHWQKIAIAASCQSWRTMVPEINPAQTITTWIRQNQDATKLILTPTEDAEHLSKINVSMPVSLLIGPEGGFSPNEVDQATTHKFIPVSLGPRILRMETAAIAAITVLQARFGDL